VPPRPYNIVLIVADAYRKDNADRAAGAPFFDRLLPLYRFSRCFSSAPWTLPACSSILSGVHSSTHGFFFHNRSLGLPTLGHYLQGDFHRVAVVNNSNLRTFTGFDSDFDEYHYVTGHQEPFDKAREAIAAAQSAKPLFLLFHTNIAHDYYLSPSRDYYESRFPDRHDWFCMDARVSNWRGLSPENRRSVRAIYDASTFNMEQRLAALLDVIDLDRTIVCFVADHGEGFEYDRARIHHGGRLHDDLLRVPLLVRLPESFDLDCHRRLAAAQDVACSSTDIAPTLLELAGYKPPGAMDGHSLLAANPGRTLPSEDRRYLYTRGRERLNVNLGGKNTTRWMRLKNFVVQRTLLRGFNIKSFIRYPYKLIVTSLALASGRVPRYVTTPLLDRMFLSSGQRIHVDNLVLSLELYDLENDPAENHNLLADLPKAELRDAVGQRLGSLGDLDVVVGGKRLTLEAATATSS